MLEKQRSKEAKWFLRNLQIIQDDFAGSIGGQIVTTDREGNLITEMSGAQEACKMIAETEKGKQRCQEAYKNALSLVKSLKEPAFMDCHAGFASLWVPIKIDGQIVGSVTGCGGRFEKGESEEELEEKYLKIAEDLGIEDKESFVKASVQGISPVTQEEMKERSERLVKLVGVLAEETALKELFSIE